MLLGGHNVILVDLGTCLIQNSSLFCVFMDHWIFPPSLSMNNECVDYLIVNTPSFFSKFFWLSPVVQWSLFKDIHEDLYLAYMSYLDMSHMVH